MLFQAMVIFLPISIFSKFCLKGGKVHCLVNSVPAMFADDTNITISAKNAEDLEEKLNDELNNVHNWLLS